MAIGHRSTLDGSERERRGNRECVLRAPGEMAERFPDDAAAVARTVELAARLEFDLTQELGYRYPDFADGEETADAQLRRVCERAFAERYAGTNGHKRRARERLERSSSSSPTSSSPASSSSTSRCSSWRGRSRSTSAARARRGTRLPPAEGAAPRWARSSAT